MKLVQPEFDRISIDPNVMGGKPCVRGLRVTVGNIVGMVASGQTNERILAAYPYLEPEDISQALAFSTWQSNKNDEPIQLNS